MACKQITLVVQRASISNLTGVHGSFNVQGEDQKKLHDAVCNEVSVKIASLQRPINPIEPTVTVLYTNTYTVESRDKHDQSCLST